MPSSRGSSQPGDRTCISYISCTGRWVLYHRHHLRNPLLVCIRNKKYFRHFKHIITVGSSGFEVWTLPQASSSCFCSNPEINKPQQQPLSIQDAAGNHCYFIAALHSHGLFLHTGTEAFCCANQYQSPLQLRGEQILSPSALLIQHVLVYWGQPKITSQTFQKRESESVVFSLSVPCKMVGGE